MSYEVLWLPIVLRNAQVGCWGALIWLILGEKGSKIQDPGNANKPQDLKKNRHPVEADRLDPNEQEQSKLQSDNRHDIMEHKHSNQFYFVVSSILLHLFFLNTKPN